MLQTEKLAELQQGRLETARERMLSLRNQVVDGILEAAGLEKSDKENYSIHLGRIEAWDINTTEVLGRMGLAAGGMMTVPVLIVGTKDGDLDFEAKQNRFRLKFKDWKEIPIFGLGFETEDHSFSWLYDIELSTLSKNFDEPELKCLGILANSAFGVTLPEEAKFLFNKAGWLRTEKELGFLVKFLSRTVDLRPESLTREESANYLIYLLQLQDKDKDKASFIQGVKQALNLTTGKGKECLLDGDMNVLVGTFSVDGIEDYLFIKIPDIVLPPPSHNFTDLAFIVRPKDDNHRGDLIIHIFENGEISCWVKRQDYEDAGIKIDNLIHPQSLAAILAKIKAE